MEYPTEPGSARQGGQARCFCTAGQPRDKHGKPKPQAQRNFTDPESRIQKMQGGFLQGYNAQAAVDEGHQIIVAQALTNQPPDVEHFVPLRTKKGRAVYARRKAVAEAPFGQIKQVRGFRQLLLQGLAKARGEWVLICLTHNLLKLYRAAVTA